MIISRLTPFSLNESEDFSLNLLGMKLISSLTEREMVLLESGDYVATLTDVTHEFGQQPHLRNFRVYRNETGDHVITFEKQGAVEIHHADRDFKSGSILTHEHDSKGPNTKFISMIAQLGKTFIDAGKKVRISAPTDMLKKYHRIVNFKTKKDDSIGVSPISYHKLDKDASGNDVQFDQFYITPNVITEAVKLISRTSK